MNSLHLTAILSMAIMASSSFADTKSELMTKMMQTATPADVLNTSPQIWEDAIATTLQAQEEMPWGDIVPKREFENFVLPLRVNNEPIDGHRPVIYRELKDRVKNLSMEDAILEVNHWCHEYVNYQPSDGRTHSPLQSMSSLIGRCGEESTFTVSALRAVGIPARQVYTPRWAHTDDNHAWVEAWANGKWYFMGACEPEPLLNMAWFNAPATRGMMMHTFVRGDYDGPEEVVERTKDGVNINVTSTYAPVTETTVTVTDTDGNPAAGADVSFRIYNYAEFYPLGTKKSDAMGEASITSGIGDMLVWATNGTDYGFATITAGEKGNIELSNPSNQTFSFTLTPPKQGSNIVTPTAEQKDANARRLAHEDSIRAERLKLFMTGTESEQLSERLGLQPNRVFEEARGNHKSIVDFLSSLPMEERQKGLLLLRSLPIKDLSDITLDVLKDAMAAPEGDGELYAKYVLSPRVEVEQLYPSRTTLQQFFAENRESFRSNPNLLVEWIKDSISVISDWHPSQNTITPAAALKARKANARSREILFVSAARALGIPARVDPISGKTQWADNENVWHNVVWQSGAEVSSAKGKLNLVADTTNRIDNPGYYTHFTLSKIENGAPRLLEFDDNDTYQTAFREPIELEAGRYILTTGQRLANGGVLAKMDIFEIEPNTPTEMPLTIRHDDSQIEVIGNFNSENRYNPLSYDGTKGEEKSILSTTGRGYYILVLANANHEPSNHVLRDIAAEAEAFEAIGTPIVVLLPEDTQQINRVMGEISGLKLPSTAHYGIDTGARSESELKENLNLEENQLPIVVIADTFNRIVYATQGYTIGSGRKLLDILQRI